jgi:hypothetical protein
VLIEMIIELQEELGIHLVQGDLKNVSTVGDLIELLKSRNKKYGVDPWRDGGCNEAAGLAKECEKNAATPPPMLD